MMRASRYAIGLLALQACSSPDSRSPSDDSDAKPAISAESEAELEKVLDDTVAAGVALGVSLSVEVPGHRIWSSASGIANVETGDTLTPGARFRAGSMVKPAVATAILELVESGDLSLDAKLTELLPAAISQRVPQASDISLRMLLNHTSGIPEFSTPEFEATVAGDPMHVWTLDELLDWALSHEPSFAPGAGWSYSNTDYILLGAIIEGATGESWRTTVREQVLSRAGLENSALPEEGDPRCAGCSRGYIPIESEFLDATEIDPSMAGAAGGHAFVSRPDDLVKFLRALAAGEMFDENGTLELMLDFVDAPNPAEAQTGYGLGIQRFQLGGIELVGHLGGTAGFQGFVLLHPESGKIASGYMNQNGDFGAFLVPVIEAVGRAH